MRFFFKNQTILAIATFVLASATEAEEGQKLSLPEAQAALQGETFDCSMAGGVVFRLFFPDVISGDQIDYRFRLAGETDRRPMTYRIEGDTLVSARDDQERQVFALGSGDVRIARPGEVGAVCRRD